MSSTALAALRQRLRRRRRRIALGLLILAGAAACAWGILIEGTVLRHVVAWAIGAQLNATCTIERFRWNGWSHAEISGLSLRVDDWPESASEVASIARMRADFDLLPLLWGSLALTDITIDEMTIRAIERDDGSAINLMKIELPATRGGTVRPPRINIQGLSLKIGALDAKTGAVVIDAVRELAGGLFNDRAVRDKWHVELTQKDALVSDPARLTGWLVGETFEYEMTLSNLKLDDALRRLFPGPIRQLWKQMDLRGSIDQVVMSGDKEHPVRSARVEVTRLELTLPDPGIASAFARYSEGRVEPNTGLPRIHVERGVVRFDEWRLSLEQLQGRLASSNPDPRIVAMPVELSFTVDLQEGRLWDWNAIEGQLWTASDSERWAASALEHAPFDLRLVVQNFAIKDVDGRPPALELPIMAAEILHNFMAREGTVSIVAHASRAPPIWRNREGPDEDFPDEGPIASEVHFDGAVSIQGGRGGYFKFPYELTDVRAYVAFNDDVLDVQYVRGRGSEGAEVTVSGTVLNPGDDAGIDLRITSDRAPIDDQLIGALRYSPAQRFLTLLFDVEAFRSLEASGVLQATVDKLRSDRVELLARTSSSEQPETPEARDALAAEVRSLRALDWLARFQPGGWCALNLRVQRDVAGGERVSTTGTITLIEANALCEPLPYPLRVLGRDTVGAPAATITLEDERIVLPDGGLRMELPGGGEGSVSGVIEFPRGSDGERVVTPRVKIETRGDAINPLLLAAIPIDNPVAATHAAREGWPGARKSEVAQALEAIQLEGVLAAEIDLSGDGTGAFAWEALLALSDGQAEPRGDVGSEMASSGLEWPIGFRLSDCSASVIVDEGRAKLLAFEGWHGEGIVRGTGEVDLTSEARSLQLGFHFVPLGAYLVNLLPQEKQEDGRVFWASHSPEGNFDAALDWSMDAAGKHQRTLRVTPYWVSFKTTAIGGATTVRDQLVMVRRTSGDLAVIDRTLAARGLQLSIDEADGHESSLVLDGRYGAAVGGDGVAIGASWTGGRLESPLVMEGLELAGAEQALELWREVRPHGGFDAILTTLAGPDTDDPPWRIRMLLGDLALSLDGEKTALKIDAASEPITIESMLVTLPSFVAHTENGRIELAGEIPLDARMAQGRVLRVQYDGARLGLAELSLFGKRASDALEEIEFLCAGPTQLIDSELQFGLVDGSSIARFVGTLEVSQASFRTGIDFDGLDGVVRVDIDPAKPSTLDIRARSFRIEGHSVVDAEAIVLIAADGSRVDVPKLNGTLAGGSASAQVTVRRDPARTDGGDYEVWARLVGGQLSELPASESDDASSRSASGNLASGASGRVDAELTVGGPLDDPQRRVGLGRLEIRDGRMADLPITMSLLHVTQLMLPLTTALDSGDIRFHVTGDRVIFDRFRLTSPTIEFRGSGEFDLRTDDLALRFRNRGTVPLWSDLFGVVSDTLFAIDVRGPLSDPVVSVAPLPPLNRAPSAAHEELRR